MDAGAGTGKIPRSSTRAPLAQLRSQHVHQPLLLSAGTSSSGRLQTCAGHWTWLLRSNTGRLHAEVMHRRRTSGDDDTQLLTLKLWARGPIDKESGLKHGLDIGHDAIVDTFFEITSDMVHEYWGELS